MASALSCPVGFKNGTDGNTRIAVDAIRASRASHMFLSPDKQGQMTIYQTSGNPYGHIIMRGGKRPNYHAPRISPPPARRYVNSICRNSWSLISAMATARSSTAVSWKCAPISVSKFARASTAIAGIMAESFLQEGTQKVVPASR
ncbi:hypothetical protein LN650_13100 [Klebsiella pneumoniae subsp. pneumoniae]|nr:hypothetical protein [Klebsiella pneumoniae subsp. pneumoniae]